MRSSYKKVSGMTAEIKIRRCYGCGGTLQAEDRYEPGFVNPGRYGADDGLCDRCYRLRHPHPEQAQTIDKDFVALLAKARKSGALFCYVMDAFALDSSLIPGIADFLGTNILVVINKTDILPANISRKELLEGVDRRLSLQHIKPVGYLVTSAFKDFDNKDFIATIDRFRKGKDVYFVGVSRVGKSALINNFLKFYDNPTDRTITKERIADSDMALTAIPLDAGSSLYDTPGIFNPTSLLNQIDRRALKYVIPKERVKSRTESLRDGEALLLGALAYVVYEAGPKTTLELFFSEGVEIVKTRALHAADEFTALCQTGRGHPVSATIKDADALECNPVVLPAAGEIVISIKGLGKLRFVAAAGTKLGVYVPKGVGVALN